VFPNYGNELYRPTYWPWPENSWLIEEKRPFQRIFTRDRYVDNKLKIVFTAQDIFKKVRLGLLNTFFLRERTLWWGFWFWGAIKIPYCG